MRLISTKMLRTGMVLGNTIYNVSERPLLQENVLLTERMIGRLKELSVQYVYIDDERSKGIEVKESVSVEVRRKALSQMEESFKSVTDSKGKVVPYILDQKSKEFRNIVREVLDDLHSNADLLTVLSDAYIYDSYIFHHSFNVTLYTLAIAKQLKLPQQQLELIGMGAILHDIGKIMVPEEVLLKPGALTENEFLMIKDHTTHGFEILRNLHSVSILVAHCAFQHHERLDGSGYPRGILAKDIHPYAKIMAVADVFDAVTSNRVYRKKMLPSQGLEILHDGEGRLFDKTVIKAFKQAVAIFPNGLSVELNDGRRGIISSQNKGFATRPNIRIMQNGEEIIENPYEISLIEMLNVEITNTDIVLSDL
ncbi:HD-GYP domain-containing protein [Jeotgalibacillus soli]|uniref:Hisitidine kinase n=1 Tax=Jeotgalibacillus soli TaxID=889306 RepID=A0A0C2RLM3_9BACL|nr:HD domain-containing phosphohydrolase [Jeotgalibacillus soli]KIL42644.1 hisitidine kinase [Jeotgalibacillus soli]